MLLKVYFGQIPTKERKVPQGDLVFQHVNARVGICPKFRNRSCASDPIGLCRVLRALATHPDDRRLVALQLFWRLRQIGGVVVSNLLLPTTAERQEYRDLICCEPRVRLGQGLIG
jgi:hypothetical protein